MRKGKGVGGESVLNDCEGDWKEIWSNFSSDEGDSVLNPSMFVSVIIHASYSTTSRKSINISITFYQSQKSSLNSSAQDNKA